MGLKTHLQASGVVSGATSICRITVTNRNEPRGLGQGRSHVVPKPLRLSMAGLEPAGTALPRCSLSAKHLEASLSLNFLTYEWDKVQNCGVDLVGEDRQAWIQTPALSCELG